MTRSEIIGKLQVLGMGPEAEKQFKELLQCFVAGTKATTNRRQRQQEYRWKVVSGSCLGLGLYWLEIARERRWIKC